MTTYQPQPPAPGRKPRKSKRRYVWPAVAAACLFVGIGAGAGNARTVEKTVEVEKRVTVPGPERVVNVPGPTVRVEVVPQSCLTALDMADEGFTILSGTLREILGGNYNNSTNGNEKLATLAPKYNAVKTECRMAAK